MIKLLLSWSNSLEIKFQTNNLSTWLKRRSSSRISIHSFLLTSPRTLKFSFKWKRNLKFPNSMQLIQILMSEKELVNIYWFFLFFIYFVTILSIYKLMKSDLVILTITKETLNFRDSVEIPRDGFKFKLNFFNFLITLKSLLLARWLRLKPMKSIQTLQLLILNWSYKKKSNPTLKNLQKLKAKLLVLKEL